ncbi:MAG: hypothetical protein COB36_10975 [Alphaproteobacteria bacterium]|nr:MAG: hypothetical protein COB36_10975 [Alphaproteobacteria bacterium]
MTYDQKLANYAHNTRQAEIYKAVCEHGNCNKAAKVLGVSHQTISASVRKLKVRAAKMGYSPDHDMTHSAAPGFATKRISTAYNQDGDISQQWHIQEPEKVALAEIQEGMLEAFKEDLFGLYNLTEAPEDCNKKLMSCYLIGDHHFGMYAWGEETGQGDYDTEIAEKILIETASKLIARSPASETGALINVGDFLHANDTTAQTPASKVNLDVDGRMGRVGRMAGLLLKTLISLMLQKHKKVIVINARGNHDPDSALGLNEVVRAYFYEEPRVEVMDNFNKFIHFEFGKNLIVVHHGDRIKADRIYQAVTKNLADAWGRCPHRYGWTGHIHHKEAQEIGGMMFESWGVLPPPDAWHSNSGYGAERSMTCVVLHDENGEDIRFKVKI